MSRFIVTLGVMEFRRDRVTWMAYAMLAWFAYLQAAPGLVVPHLRDELDIGYGVGGLHVAAFATGSLARRADRGRAGAARTGGGRCCGVRPRCSRSARSG